MKKWCLLTIILVAILIVGIYLITISDMQGNTIEKNESNIKTYKAMKYTIFDNSDANKFENIKLAVNYINGIKLKSGEEFSFNNVLGKRTAEKGYKPATVIIRGNDGKSYKSVDIGGGICQVSSTLHMTCKELNLEIIERRPHTMKVDYCTREEEAMVNWGTSDFRFKNNLNEDITIKAYITSNTENTFQQKLVCEIW